ncbi:uncharacterized protein H6S33_003848 [Morchella sextelata]|uniref:uncharacterized protein n=1 Tax=Morchella sextelata TaxID=1174677 RepID=UPI001D051510|nr:uncharacterized protein H6S33_003848 [Morchella sextelata]KAH0606187.1 hypothetical protein H6S33_003848 [Morchella sextelata]
MKNVLSLALLAALPAAFAQQSAYGQCGGVNWTGATTCVSGYYCSYGNAYYSQCVPGTASTTTSTTAAVTSGTTTSRSSSSTTLVTSTTTTSATVSASACPTAFTSIPAQSFITNMNPGWNLGNTLDAVPDETSWGNILTPASVFDDVKAKGFKGVRLPVTWADHFSTGSPSWTVTPAWMDRVETVVDYALARDLYVILNVHHDSWEWADFSASGANVTMIEEKFVSLWTQIGTRFKCKSSLLAFEPLNEPVGTTEAHGTQMNRMNMLFLQTIRAVGGYNAQRVVTLVGLGEDSVKTSQWFEFPSGYESQPWALQYHYYSPYMFTFGAWGATTWGSDADKTAMEADIAGMRANFTDVPLIIGEWNAFAANTENAARWKYYDHLMKLGVKYNTATVLWVTGWDDLNRSTHVWRNEVDVNIVISGTKGVANSLPDSTTDTSATTQSSSAFIFHKVSDAVSAQTLPFQLNGNTVSSIKSSAKTLVAGTDYSVSGSNIVFATSYLSTLYSATTAAGILDTLNVTFSAGAGSQIQVVQWDVPTLSTTTSKAVTGTDLYIPITWKGYNHVAAVRALKADGTYLFDDWTVYLPALQQARITYGQYGWDSSNVILWAAVQTAVVSAGQATTFMFEFFPRVPGNSVNYTLTV